MHIRENEATDSIDWEYFYSGDKSEFPKWAHLLWSLLHDAMDNIPCGTCQPDGIDLMRAFHDLKNFELNKPIKYESNFLHAAKRYADAADHIRANKLLEVTV